jgi:hypothetical protein
MKIGKQIIACVLILTSISLTKAQTLNNSITDNRSLNSKYSLEDLALNLNSNLAPSNHMWVMSGWSTVSPVSGTVMGVGECIGPPLAGRDFRLMMTLEANGHQVKDIGSTGKGDVGLLYSGGKWRPDRIIRNGTYHFMVKDTLISFSVQSELIPLFGRTGFLLKVNLKNRTDKPLKIRLHPDINPGKPSVNPLNKWTFGQPPRGNDAKPEGENHWSNETVDIDLFRESNNMEILSGGTKIAYLAILFSEKDKVISFPGSLKFWEAEVEKAWNDRLEWALKSIPVIESNIPGLDDYYKRSVVSGLVCIWENPSFALNPFLSTLGIDGGGICSYLWDLGGYSPQMASLLLGDKVVNNARAMTAIDLTKYYAYTLDGSGIGVPYSYSTWSYVNLVWNIWKQTGEQKELFDEAVRLVLENEKLQSKQNGLIDYGVQNNLLEMRSAGWEHFVVSPNAERAWCLERLADMGDKIGLDKTTLNQWRKMASEIRTSVQRTLWDPERKWFKSIYPDGHEEFIYSIQAYDALRAGVCTKEMEEALISHLREGAFLFPYGITSISAEDSIHYEVNDPDWSGGGAYTGEGPVLAQTMYEFGRAELAFDILQRFFWMGRHLPYFPQEVFADRPAAPANKRANEISGMTGAQTILYGMAGFDPRIDGSLWINPQIPENVRLKVSGYGWKQNRIDVSVINNTISIFLNGEKNYSGKQKQIRIL